MRAILLAGIVLVTSAAGPSRPGPGGGEARSYPQPVPASALAGRKLIGADEAQPLLGRIEGVVRAGDGALALRVRRASLWPWGGRTVDVPIAQVRLLGELVALTGIDSAQLDALPPASPGGTVPAGETIEVGLVRPFH